MNRAQRRAQGIIGQQGVIGAKSKDMIITEASSFLSKDQQLASAQRFTDGEFERYWHRLGLIQNNTGKEDVKWLCDLVNYMRLGLQFYAGAGIADEELYERCKGSDVRGVAFHSIAGNYDPTKSPFEQRAGELEAAANESN